MIKIDLPVSFRRAILALGSQTKNTVCFVQNKTAYVSAVHKDLGDPEDLSAFEKAAGCFLRQKPGVVACDLHPEYASTRYLQDLLSSYRLIKSPVQHHHAHIAGCMAENGLKNQSVIGVAFDGTGLGSDGSLWGAEFLICDYKNFTRAGHLKEVALIGGEKAILEPWRLLAAWGLKRPAPVVDKRQWKLVKNMQAKAFNSPIASSMGRLFDAAAVLILGKCRASFEAELAIELERMAFNFDPSSVKYRFKIIKNKAGLIIDPGPVFRRIIKDLLAKEARPEIAYRFHLAVAKMIAEVCASLRKKTNIKRVVLSGGVFQNNLLLRLSLDLLYKEGFKVFIHKKLSCNDSGLSLGQAVVAGLRSPPSAKRCCRG